MIGRSIVLDPLWFDSGHVRPFRNSILEELLARDMKVDLLCNDLALVPNGVSSRRIRRLGPKAVISGRIHLARALATVDDGAGAALRLDLAADVSALWLTGTPARPWLRVLHRVPIAERHHGVGAGVRIAASRLRAKATVQALGRATRAGDRIIVHTEHAQRLLDQRGVRSTVLRLPYLGGKEYGVPVVDGDPFVLVVGPPTVAKGVPGILDALSRGHVPLRVVITGCSRSQAEDLAIAFPHVRLDPRGVVDGDTYRNLVASARLVVVVNDDRFHRSGAASAVVVDAVVHGTPIITTPGLAETTPFRSSLVEILSLDAASIGTAVDEALGRARPNGSLVVSARQEHSVATYVRRLEAMGTQQAGLG